MIIAIKREDNIHVGITTSDGYVDMTDKDLMNAENIPFWKVKGMKDCYVFVEESGRSTDLLRYNDDIFKGITDGKSIVQSVVPKMRKLLDDYERLKDGKSWNNCLLIVKGDKMFEIGNYFTVNEADEYVAFGNGKYVYGALEQYKELPPKDCILACVRDVSKFKGRRYLPLMIFDMKSKRREIFYQ